jgi:hypothetical protein
LAAKDSIRVHRLVDDPDSAEIILFVERWIDRYDRSFSALRAHPWLKQYPKKCFIYNQEDRPWQVLPGLYCSMPAHLFDARRQRACSYLGSLNDFVGRPPTAQQAEADLLFSFVGGRHARVRHDVLGLSHPRALVRDTTGDMDFDVPTELKDKRREEYAEIMARSRFILCPRGHGTGSFRLFEAMESQRVPVILSDGWVPPYGPNWPDFSLQVREESARLLPSILEEAEDRWVDMARKAREAWLEWFAPSVKFHRMTEECLSIAAGGYGPRRGLRTLAGRDRIEHRVDRIVAPTTRYARRARRQLNRVGRGSGG